MAPTEVCHVSALPAADLGGAFGEALHCAVSLAQGGDADEAAAVLRCECAGAPPAALAAAYHGVVEAFIQKDRPGAACDLVMEMDGELAALPATQERVLRALAQAQQHARVAELLRAICARASRGDDADAAIPCDAVFNGVVDAAIRSRAYSEAWDVLEILLAHQRRADKYFVSILTKSLESSSDRRSMRRCIGLVERFIEQQRDDVDEIVFNSLLNVLGHIGDMPKLQQTLDKMIEYGVPPSAVTYGTVVKAYGRSRDIDAVVRVWNEMRNRCLGVSPVTCGCVLDACVKCGQVDKAMAIFQDMRLQGLHKNTVLYATLIKGLAKVHDLMGALHLYQEMRLESVPCNLVTFNSLMDVCVRCRDLRMAALFLQDMMQMGIEPDLITFSTLIKGYSQIGEVHKALALSQELRARGLRCDEIMYNSLLDGCAKANKLQDGLAVFEDMLRSRVVPSNITFSILVKLHFEASQINEAFRLVDDMAGKYRCNPSRIVYTVLFRCCAQYGGAALQRGALLLEELAQKRGAKLLDHGMVGAVITGCVFHWDFDTAIRLVRGFTLGGARRGGNVVPLDCLRNLALQLGAVDQPRALELLEYLRKQSLPVAYLAQFQAAIAEGREQGPAARRGMETLMATRTVADAVTENDGVPVLATFAPSDGTGIGMPAAYPSYCQQWQGVADCGGWHQNPYAMAMDYSYAQAYEQHATAAYTQQMGYAAFHSGTAAVAHNTPQAFAAAAGQQQRQQLAAITEALVVPAATGALVTPPAASEAAPTAPVVPLGCRSAGNAPTVSSGAPRRAKVDKENFAPQWQRGGGGGANENHGHKDENACSNAGKQQKGQGRRRPQQQGLQQRQTSN